MEGGSLQLYKTKTCEQNHICFQYRSRKCPESNGTMQMNTNRKNNEKIPKLDGDKYKNT